MNHCGWDAEEWELDRSHVAGQKVNARALHADTLLWDAPMESGAKNCPRA